MEILILIGVGIVIYNIIKEKSEPTISASHWKNKKQIHDDIFIKGIDSKEFTKNIKNGKYK